MTLREQCIKWYGEENGNAVADHWVDVMERIQRKPTVITIPERDAVYEAVVVLRGLNDDQLKKVLARFQHKEP